MFTLWTLFRICLKSCRSTPRTGWMHTKCFFDAFVLTVWVHIVFIIVWDFNANNPGHFKRAMNMQNRAIYLNIKLEIKVNNNSTNANKCGIHMRTFAECTIWKFRIKLIWPTAIMKFTFSLWSIGKEELRERERVTWSFWVHEIVTNERGNGKSNKRIPNEKKS